ncbi:MAG: NfeD family protein [Lachnospiraceae bacterium]|nr:NfeD family protein [Lachnospiraceae bacterium]
MEVMMWLILLIVLLIIEAITVTLVCVWFAGGALVALLAAALHAPLWLQFLLFLIVALILLFFTRPIAVKYFNKDRVKTNVESLIGKQAIVVSEIDNLQGIGQATVGGQQWSARSVTEGITIPVGAVVVIEDIKGVKLMVRDITASVEKNVAKAEVEEK